MYNKETKEELSMSRIQRKYDHEYKVQAVKLAREIGGAKAFVLCTDRYPLYRQHAHGPELTGRYLHAGRIPR